MHGHEVVVPGQDRPHPAPVPAGGRKTVQQHQRLALAGHAAEYGVAAVAEPFASLLPAIQGRYVLFTGGGNASPGRKLFHRSEERRVGKEGRSSWSAEY